MNALGGSAHSPTRPTADSFNRAYQREYVENLVLAARCLFAAGLWCTPRSMYTLVSHTIRRLLCIAFGCPSMNQLADESIDRSTNQPTRNHNQSINSSTNRAANQPTRLVPLSNRFRSKRFRCSTRSQQRRFSTNFTGARSPEWTARVLGRSTPRCGKSGRRISSSSDFLGLAGSRTRT